jgi:hypothetical protein
MITREVVIEGVVIDLHFIVVGELVHIRGAKIRLHGHVIPLEVTPGGCAGLGQQRMSTIAFSGQAVIQVKRPVRVAESSSNTLAVLPSSATISPVRVLLPTRKLPCAPLRTSASHCHVGLLANSRIWRRYVAAPLTL